MNLSFSPSLSTSLSTSLSSSGDDFGLFSTIYGWLAVISLGFIFSAEEADFAFSISVIVFPRLLWFLYCYVKQRKGHDSTNLGKDGWERLWFYLSLIFLIGIALTGALMSIIYENETNLGVITMTVILFAVSFTLIPFWYGRLILYSEILKA